MSETVLQAEVGRRAGSSDARRLRADGKIPAVVYGHGMDPISVSVDRRELRQALSGAAGMNTILDLTVDGTIELERLENALHVGRPAMGQPQTTVGLFRIVKGTSEAVLVRVRLGDHFQEAERAEHWEHLRDLYHAGNFPEFRAAVAASWRLFAGCGRMRRRILRRWAGSVLLQWFTAAERETDAAEFQGQSKPGMLRNDAAPVKPTAHQAPAAIVNSAPNP
jgi:ribosomal protein L25 (general stress protein Ctc)